MGSAAIAFKDLGGSLARLPLAARLAMEDVHGKYRRTILGPLWIALGQAATIAGFVLVYSNLFGVAPQSFAIFLSAGIPVWVLMASYLSDMPNTFIAERGVIESYELPWLLHVWRRSFSYVILFVHHLLTFVVVMAIFHVEPTINMLYAIPGLLIVLFAGTGFGTFLAVVGARYRDLQPAMGVASGFLFLFTPVMWHPEQLRPELSWAYQYNPLYYYISVVREPLLGRLPEPNVWIGAGIGAIVLFFIGFVAFLMGRRRLYHWL